MEQKSCVIIGAGLSGLTAGYFLTQNGWQVTVLDKGRGVGGRMASRSFAGARFDHGAQYFSIKSLDFQNFIEQLSGKRLLRKWNVRSDGYPRFALEGGMNGLPKRIAETLDVRTGQKVSGLQNEEETCTIITETGQRYAAHHVLLTLPVPQALALFSGQLLLSESDQAALSGIRYDPCWTVMATLTQPSRIPPPGGLVLETGPVAWLADNQQKEISERPSVTIHASADFSRQHLEDDPETVQKILLGAVATWVLPATVQMTQVHRWRYSHAAQRHPAPFLRLDLPVSALIGGDAFGIGNVEGAFLSGKAMAEALLALPSE
ncbi:MAG: FAD-dependent oxidoreductase [Cytophagaceae bacterium]|nr:FAD-dependent oxidoreductase [Cytophagaceae bacterium]